MIAQWYVARGKQKLGPYSFRELKNLARTGGVLPIDMVIEDGTQKWRPAGEVEGLFWRASEEVIVGILLPPLPTNGPSPGPAPAGTTEVVANEPPVPAPPLEEAVPNAGRIEDTEAEVGPLPFLEDGSVSSAIPPVEPEEKAGTPPSESVVSDSSASASPDKSNNAVSQTAMSPESGQPPEPVTATAESHEQTQSAASNPATQKKTLFRRASATAGLCAILGLVGDFSQPIAPFNLVAFLAAGILTVSLIVLRVKRGNLLGSFFVSTCTTAAVSAAVFGTWWALAHFGGGREKGYLAERSRFLGRLQTAIVFQFEGAELLGVWRIGGNDAKVSGETVLTIKDRRLTWVITSAKSGSVIEIQAEYGLAKEGALYGIVTQVDGEPTDGLQLPELDDPFSFQYRPVDADSLTIRNLRGSGLEGVKKVVQGKYRRK